MKKIMLAFLIGGALSGFSQKQQTKPVNTLLPVKLVSASDSMQYILGVYIAQWLNSNGFSIQNPVLFTRGIDDIFQNRPRAVADSIIIPRVTLYQQSMQKEKNNKQEQQLFAALRDRPGVGTLPSGVRYIILKAGAGIHPTATDSILINLNAKLVDGTLVEDTYQANKPIAATVTSFFPGLTDALQMMSEGAKWQLFIPAALAYGERGTSLIPPHNALILEVELLIVKKKS